jgi:hypothetical protein
VMTCESVTGGAEERHVKEHRLVACASSAFETGCFARYSGVQLRWAHRPGRLCSCAYAH